MINKKSFTLIELVVSIGVLVMVILSAMGVYIQVIGTREKSIGQFNIQEDGQYLMSLLVKDIRAGMVDYDEYGVDANCTSINETTSLTTELCLLDFSSTQNQIRYETDLNESGVCSGDRCVLKRCQGPVASNTCDDDETNYQNITMTHNSVERLDFYINPTTDPFTPGSTLYEHPRVTIVLKLKSIIEKPGTNELILQQTVPQRYGQKK